MKYDLARTPFRGPFFLFGGARAAVARSDVGYSRNVPGRALIQINDGNVKNFILSITDQIA
jgi:hypothetical protein